MNVSSETLALPVNHRAHRRAIPTKHSSMFVGASPIAVNNKIRAIRTRKSRITLQSYYDFTDIRPLNIAQNSRMSNSTNTFSKLSAEKLVERSKELRLGRLANRPNVRQSVLSSISTANQQSLMWPSYNSPAEFPKQNQVDSRPNSPTALGLTPNKSSMGKMPDIPEHSNRIQTTARQLLTEQQNVLVPVESRHKSVPKMKSSIPKAYDRTLSKAKPSFSSSNTQALPTGYNDYAKQWSNNFIHIYESEEEEENLPFVMDDEFEEYVQKAKMKCADWLIKYVFDKTYDDDED